jgi:non-specific serine/threonine protein kinase
MIELLARLVDHSLVTTNRQLASSGATRYHLLEPVRQYASGLLEASGETEIVRERHAAFFAALAWEARPELTGVDQLTWLDRLELEHNTVRAAMNWLLERGDYERVARIGWGIFHFWIIRGHTDEGRLWMERALAGALSLPLDARAQLLVVVAFLACCQGDLHHAAEAADEAITAAQGAADDEVFASALLGGGIDCFCIGGCRAFYWLTHAGGSFGPPAT